MKEHECKVESAGICKERAVGKVRLTVHRWTQAEMVKLFLKMELPIGCWKEERKKTKQNQKKKNQKIIQNEKTFGKKISSARERRDESQRGGSTVSYTFKSTKRKYKGRSKHC